VTLSRRHFLTFVANSALSSSAAEYLPQNRTLIGLSKYRQIVAEGLSENWSSLPIADRMTRAALTMKGTPYAGFTLEIDDHVESAAVNFEGLDCWTFFEAALGLARMFGRRQTSYSPSDLLREIEWTRYRGGRCNGNYLDRIHYLEEWFRDNDARDNVRDITRSIAPTIQLKGRKIDEMTVLWKSYRYLKNNPELRSGMARIEAELQRHPFHYIPKNAVAAIEPKLQSGDIIGIVTHKAHVYCSHVGLALRTQDGVMRFMHASADKKRVIIDKSVSGYLADFKSHAGIIVARPR
jgi:hypothetical protein